MIKGLSPNIFLGKQRDACGELQHVLSEIELAETPVGRDHYNVARIIDGKRNIRGSLAFHHRLTGWVGWIQVMMARYHARPEKPHGYRRRHFAGSVGNVQQDAASVRKQRVFYPITDRAVDALFFFVKGNVNLCRASCRLCFLHDP